MSRRTVTPADTIAAGRYVVRAWTARRKALRDLHTALVRWLVPGWEVEYMHGDQKRIVTIVEVSDAWWTSAVRVRVQSRGGEPYWIDSYAIMKHNLRGLQ